MTNRIHRLCSSERAADRLSDRLSGRRKRAVLLSLLIACALLSGCSAFPGALDEGEADIHVTLPVAEIETGGAPVGDETASSLVRAPIYYPGAQENQYVSVLRTFRLNANALTEEKRAEELLKTPYGTEAAPAAPEGTRLAGVEISGGVATAKFLIGADFETEEKKAVFAACAAQTLLDSPEIRAVNVLVNGRAMEYKGVPLGALGGETANLGEWLERLESESETRSIVFYCPAKYGEYLIPEIRTARVSGADAAQSLLDGLYVRPASDALFAGLTSEYALSRPCEIGFSAGGARVLDLFFTMEAYQTMTESGDCEWKRLASVALTFTAFYPDIDGVRVHFGDYVVTDTEDWNGNTLRFRDGVITREDFSGRVGALVKLYFADADGRLSPEERAVSRSDAHSLRARVALLMEGPRSAELRKTFPEGVDGVDILGTALESGVAKIHFSAGFYGKCQSLEPEKEALLVYSMVNTLALDADIQAVRVYIAGESARTLAGTCSLMGPILPNPGLNVR